MSLFGNLFGKDNSAQQQQQQNMQMIAAMQAQQAEADRQRRLQQGNAAIDGAFSGFDDGFYNKYRDSITGYYMPQIENQYNDARDKLTFALARAGTLRSSVAADKQAGLAEQNALNEAGVLNKADQQAADLKTRVASEKANAQQQLRATEDPSIAANLATTASRNIQTTNPDLSPLSGVFDIGAIGAAGAVQGYNNQQLYNAYGMPGGGGIYSDASRNIT